jgi:hypothetical protein
MLWLLDRIISYIGERAAKKAEEMLATETWYSFPPVRSGKILRFEVKNFDEFDVDELAPPLAEQGSWIVCADASRNRLVIHLEAPDVEIEDIQNVLKEMGVQANLQTVEVIGQSQAQEGGMSQ